PFRAASTARSNITSPSSRKKSPSSSAGAAETSEASVLVEAYSGLSTTVTAKPGTCGSASSSASRAWPATTTADDTPHAASESSGRATIGWPPTASAALGRTSVSGRSRDPTPAARITAWLITRNLHDPAQRLEELVDVASLERADVGDLEHP